MKLHFILISSAFTFLFLSGQLSTLSAQGFTNAGEYMTMINSEYGAYNENMWQYIRAVAHGKNARKIEAKRKDLLRTTLLIQRKIKGMPAYEGDGSFRDSVANYFKLCYQVLNHDYKEIVDLEEIAEQSYDLMEAYILTKEKANEKLDEAGERLSEYQEDFADMYNVNLVDGDQSKTSKNLEEAGKAFKYYNHLYLVFFKSYKQEAYLMEALQNADMNALLQNQNALARTSKEGLAILDTFPTFSGDASLIEVCRANLSFYSEEATDHAPKLADYYLQKDSFEKIKAAFDAKKAKDRTQEDVDQYNDAVNSYNASIGVFNSTNEFLNKSRGKLLTDWNKSADKFLNRHVP